MGYHVSTWIRAIIVERRGVGSQGGGGGYVVAATLALAAEQSRINTERTNLVLGACPTRGLPYVRSPPDFRGRFGNPYVTPTDTPSCGFDQVPYGVQPVIQGQPLQILQGRTRNVVL